MASAVALSPQPRTSSVTPGDRLGLTIFFALIAHAIVILGIGFTAEDRPGQTRSSLDIVLVPTKSKQAPDKVDFLAQANQDGGGDSPNKERPSTPAPAPFVSREARIATAPPPAPPPSAAPEERTPAKAILTRNQSDDRVPAKPRRPTPPPEKERRRTKPVPKPTVTVPELSAAALLSQSLEMSSLNAEINRRLQAYAERPRRKFINARTKEYKYASYMEAWRTKVERVGNLNYPDEARRRKLSGSLLLDVSLNPDGDINKIVLRRSSGFKVLDDAAIRIVRLAAPFAPFPADIRSETDILHIERTWQFLGSNRLFAR